MTTVHRFWAGPPDARNDVTGRQLLDVGHDVTDWTPATIPGEYLDIAAATAHHIVDADQARHVANVVRLGLLFTFGGWWADHDLTALAPFTDLPTPATAAHRSGARCNCWLAFEKQHPALVEALAAILDTEPGPPRRSTQVSGEQLLERILAGHDVARVPVYRDVDGHTNPEAPRVFDHAGRTANRRTA